MTTYYLYLYLPKHRLRIEIEGQVILAPLVRPYVSFRNALRGLRRALPSATVHRYDLSSEEAAHILKAWEVRDHNGACVGRIEATS